MAFIDNTVAQDLPKPLTTRFTGWFGRFFQALKTQCRENMALITLCVTAFIGLFVAMASIGGMDQIYVAAYMKRALLSITPQILILYVFYRVYQLSFIEKPDFILGTLVKDIWRAATDEQRYARMIPMLLIASFGFIAFTTLKGLLPEFVPFYADIALVDWERALHFGKLPQDWLAPILSFPSAVVGLDFLYKLWYLFMFGFWGWAAWGRSDNSWRRQFILAFMLCWILGGTVLAFALSSVGPCFYGDFVNSVNPYADYMTTLKTVHAEHPLMAMDIQAMMINIFENGSRFERIGISAMPSLHNMLAVLFAITAYKVHRGLGHLMAVYAVIILIGSVVLGWHYALDGYAGAVLALFFWKLAGWILRLQDRWLNTNPSNELSRD